MVSVSTMVTAFMIRAAMSDFNIETTRKIPGLSPETSNKLSLLQADME